LTQLFVALNCAARIAGRRPIMVHMAL